MNQFIKNPALAALAAKLDEALAAKNAPTPEVDATVEGLDSRLHGYQVQAVKHLRANPRSGLFLEMGLGKTATTLQALQPHHLPALVIAPKRVAENVWGTEVGIWRPDLSIAIAAGTPTKRALAMSSGADIVAIGRDNLKDILPGQFKTIILDELSSFKNRASQRWKFAKKVCDRATYVWGLTGTPAPNGLMDLWAQVALIDSGARLGKTLTSYRQRFFYPGRQLSSGVITEWIAREESQPKIMSLLADIVLSMQSVDHLDLPPVTYNPVSVPMDAKTQKMHDDFLRDLVITKDDGEFVMADSLAVAMNKASQITAGFMYTEDGATIPLHQNKIEAVSEIVEGTGSPVLVFYQYKAERDMLLKALPQARTVEEKGIIEEWNRGEVPVLLAHPASAGHGLNLQKGGHTIIWTTLTWNLEYWGQANARLARQGQENPVVVHMLISPNSVDLDMRARVIDKQSLQDMVMNALKRVEEN